MYRAMLSLMSVLHMPNEQQYFPLAETHLCFVCLDVGEIGQVAKTTALHGFTCAVGVLRVNPATED